MIIMGGKRTWRDYNYGGKEDSGEVIIMGGKRTVER